MVFFRSEFFFRTPRELEYLFLLQRAARNFFYQNLTLSYMTKTLNQIIFLSSTKIRILFSARLWIRIFFFRKNHNTPSFKLNGRSLTESMNEFEVNWYISLFMARTSYLHCLRTERKIETDTFTFPFNKI